MIEILEGIAAAVGWVAEGLFWLCELVGLAGDKEPRAKKPGDEDPPGAAP